jgi:hypothetical protein
MKKIIDLTESDLKRIVKKVLNERQQLNEEPISTLAIVGWSAAAIAATWGGIEIANWWGEGNAQQRAESLVQTCQRMKTGKGLQTKDELINLADEYHKACPSTGYFTNCKEEVMGQILSKIKSVPDFCTFIDEFQRSGYGDWLEITDSAMDTSAGWDEYVNRPLATAVRTTDDANKKVEESGKVDTDKLEGGDKSGTGGNKGTSGGDGTVRDLQQLLKDKGYDIGSYGVDGKFGGDTLEATLKALRDSLK